MRRGPRLLVLLLGAALVGCASRAPTKPAPGAAVDLPPATQAAAADSLPDTTRVTPPPAPVKPPAQAPTTPASPPEPAPETPPPPVESVISPAERRQAMARIVADTTAAGTAVRRCAGRQLLPDQESVFDTARNLLGQVRAALERDELWRAESLARKARQLASSLNCPG